MSEVKDGDTIAVWFSSGAASAVAAKLTLEDYGERCNVRVINNPVAEEDEDNLRFLQDVQNWLGVEIEFAINPKFPAASAVEVWDSRQAMSFPTGAPCTVELKKRARQAWEAENRPNWHVMGFTAEERHRHDRFVLGERDNLIPVLINHRMSKPDCFMRLLEAGIELPRVYEEGYPNANCLGCVKATSPTYWNHVRRTRPDVFDARAEQSRRIGTKLVQVKGERIFLDELDPLAEGAPMRNMDFECGIFCMEG